MSRLSDARKKSLVDATIRYRESLPGSPAEEYLATRGLMGESIATAVGRFRLGFVRDPVPGHEAYRGMLAIPYLRQTPSGQWTVVSIRFRCIVEACDHRFHGKYNTVAGDRPRLYNTVPLAVSEDQIGISEGEIDAITATVSGVPTVGVAGTDAWLPHFAQPFRGYETVWVFQDNDDDGAGHRFATSVAGVLPNAVIVTALPGEDINSMIVKHGKAALLQKLGK
ncbi:MAG: topoisomerase [Umezawaea sp.]